jgi:hypothetical protein
MLPVMAFFSWRLGGHKRKLYFDNFIFSIEVCSFFILWGFLVLPLLLVIAKMCGLEHVITREWQTGLAIIIVCFVYTLLASKRFFRFTWWYSAVYSFLFFFLMVAFLQYVYKFILFVVAINLV